VAQLHEDHVLQETVDAIRFAGGNKAAAARNLGLPLSTLKSRVEAAQLRGLTGTAPVEKPRIRVPARSVYQPIPDSFAEPVRVFVWGCAHDAPNIPDKSRFAHAGKLAAELRPDYIVDLGDSLDLDSLSTHAVPGSVDHAARPAFLTEMASLEEAYGEFAAEAPSADDVPRYHLDGNHEYRADRFESLNPTTEGVYTLPLAQVFARTGFTTKKYREWLFLNGVGFTHCPVNSLGREYGGKTAENQVLNETTFSVVWSHIHRMHHARRSKIGVGNGLQSYNTGTFLPQGYIKRYAGLSQTGWSYGVSELTLRDGQIESARYWSTRELHERYS
jgi:hypothetical protein